MHVLAAVLQRALEKHERQYSGAQAYQAEVVEWAPTAAQLERGELSDTFVVELRAAHFSVPLRYEVKRSEVEGILGGQS